MSQASPRGRQAGEAFTMSPLGEAPLMTREAPMELQRDRHPISCRCLGETKAPGIQLTLQQPLQRSRSRCEATETTAITLVEIIAVWSMGMIVADMTRWVCGFGCMYS